MRTTRLGNTGEHVPVIGQGTWKMGQEPGKRSQEIEALGKGIENGATLIDTAKIIRTAKPERDRRRSDQRRAGSDLFRHQGVARQRFVRWRAQGGLKAAAPTDGPDRPLPPPLAERRVSGGETMRAMRQLLAGRHRALRRRQQLFGRALGRSARALGDHPVVCNQVVYNLNNRVIEKQVKPYCDRHQITVMAYSPLGDGNFPEPGSPERETLDRIGAKYGVSAYQVASIGSSPRKTSS